VAGSCEYGDEPSGSVATELASYVTVDKSVEQGPWGNNKYSTRKY
jgi:hypothetical protein